MKDTYCRFAALWKDRESKLIKTDSNMTVAYVYRKEGTRSVCLMGRD